MVTLVKIQFISFFNAHVVVFPETLWLNMNNHGMPIDITIVLFGYNCLSLEGNMLGFVFSNSSFYKIHIKILECTIVPCNNIYICFLNVQVHIIMLSLLSDFCFVYFFSLFFVGGVLGGVHFSISPLFPPFVF